MPLLDEFAKLGAPLFGDQLSSFLHPEDAYQAALEALQKRFNEAKKYLTPYANQGQEQYGRLNEGIGQLLRPEDLMSRFVSSYDESPYAKQLLEKNRQRGLEGASSMGLMGSSAALGNIQQGAGDIVSKDRQQYLNDLMSNYLSGLGLSGDIYRTGAGAAGSLMGGTTKMGENEAGLIYNREAAPGNLINNFLKMGMQAFGGGMDGGWGGMDGGGGGMDGGGGGFLR